MGGIDGEGRRRPLVANRGGNGLLVTNNRGGNEALTADAPHRITNYNITNIYVGSLQINNDCPPSQINDCPPFERIDDGQPSQINDVPDIIHYEPRFCLAPSCTQALTFGMAVPRRWYRATKHTNNNSQLISYAQTSSRTQTSAHIMTAGLTPHRYH